MILYMVFMVTISVDGLVFFGDRSAFAPVVGGSSKRRIFLKVIYSIILKYTYLC